MFGLQEFSQSIEIDCNFFDLDYYSTRMQKCLDLLKQTPKSHKITYFNLTNFSRLFGDSNDRTLRAIRELHKFGFLNQRAREYVELFRDNFYEFAPFIHAKEIKEYITENPSYLLNFEHQKNTLNMSSMDFNKAWRVLSNSFRKKSHSDEYINRMNDFKHCIISQLKEIHSSCDSNRFELEFYMKKYNISSLSSLVENKEVDCYGVFRSDFDDIDEYFSHARNLRNAIEEISENYRFLNFYFYSLNDYSKRCMKEVPFIDFTKTEQECIFLPLCLKTIKDFIK